MDRRLRQLLLDLDGFIIAYQGMIPGKANDVQVEVYNKQSESILSRNFALGDLEFRGTGFVVSGLRQTDVDSLSKIAFFKVSKREQRLIEHVNKFIKGFRSISKEDIFVPNEAKLLACISIDMWLYNLKRSYGYLRVNIIISKMEMFFW